MSSSGECGGELTGEMAIVVVVVVVVVLCSPREKSILIPTPRRRVRDGREQDGVGGAETVVEEL